MVDGEGCLTLKRGQMQREAANEPAVILRNQGMLIWEEGKEFTGLKQTDIRDERTDRRSRSLLMRARPTRKTQAHSPS